MEEDQIALIAVASYLIGYIMCMFVGWVSKGQDESREQADEERP